MVMGDARLSLERELKDKGPLNYDVIHLDAFSGDAIPGAPADGRGLRPV